MLVKLTLKEKKMNISYVIKEKLLIFMFGCTFKKIKNKKIKTFIVFEERQEEGFWNDQQCN